MPTAIWTYPAADVWTAACAAQRVNKTYVKTGTDTEPTNKVLLWQFLTGELDVTEQDRSMGEQARLHCQGKIMSMLGGNVNPFDKKVAEIAHRESFDHRADLAFVAFLPSMYLRDIRRQELDFVTQPVGAVGQRLMLTLEIDEMGFSDKYGIYWHNARQDTNRFFFFSSKPFEAGQTYKVSARVKAHRDNGTTQLSHVKKVDKN
jgi:hypothetical protein